MEFDSLVQGPGERHLIYGGTRTGKSSLMDMSIRHIQRERPECMCLVLDTKPRFRAQYQIGRGIGHSQRSPADKLYLGWAKGPVMPNSVTLDWDSRHPFRGMWDYDKHPGEVVFAQSDEPSKWMAMLQLAKHFVALRTTRERLLVIDEGMDFYQRNTLGIDARNDIILRAARAGGERHIGLLFGAHRPYGIPPLLNTMSSRVTLFHLRFQKDMQYLYGMGIPEDDEPPGGDYIFHQYSIAPGGVVSPPVAARLRLPQSYLDQLSST